MEVIPRDIDYYITEEGKAPFTEWLDALEVNVRGRVEVRLKKVEQGNFGDHHAEGSGVWALILDFGPGYRVYYGLTDKQKVVLLLTGGTKRRQNSDIAEAKRYWAEYKKSQKEA
jgi:putative addiction module killer protein